MRKRLLSVLLICCVLTATIPYVNATITYGEWSPWGDTPIQPSDTVEVETQQVVDVEGHTEYRYGRWVGATVNWCKEYGESLHGGTYSVQETEWSTERAVDTNTHWLCGHFDWEHSSHIHASGTDSRGYPMWTKYNVSGYSNPNFFWEETRWVDTTYKTQYRWREIIITPDNFTVYFDPNGGVVEPGSKSVTNGDYYGNLPTPVYTGYSFGGWFTDPNGGDIITSGTVVNLNGNQTLYAHWTRNAGPFTLTFAANGGYVNPTSKSVYNGEPYGELPTPFWNDHQFDGWFTEADGGNRIFSSTIVDLYADQTLYAHWTYAPPPVIVPPTITTNPASAITKNSTSFSAVVNNDGGDGNLTRRFIYWDKYDSSSRYTVDADANFQKTVRNLSPASTYYYYAKATNGAGDGIGSVLSFTTEPEDEPQSIEVSPTYLSLREGESYQLLASVFPATALNRNVIWSSSNPNIVKVDESGRITARKNGEAVITATTEVNRLTASCTVNVTENAIGGAFDFSEWNLATNTSSYAEDGFDWDTATDGGNYEMATAYLARWDGAVLEQNDAYPPRNSNKSSRPFYHEVNSDYHVQEVIWLPKRDNSLDNDELKAAVIQYGALYVSFYVNWNFFDKPRKNYYLPADAGRNGTGWHAVALVGWDDNYPASKFVRTPPGNGAFICKNSWGRNSGENGYFYISYYDNDFCSYMSAVVPSIERNINYNTIYQYDPLGPCSYLSATYVANVFPQNGTSLSQNETLQAVSFYTYDKNTSYEVYVVENYQDSASLVQTGSTVASGVIRDMGYHTVTLNREVVLQAGSRFAVIVKFNTESGIKGTFYEYPKTNYSSKARANLDESYYSDDGINWVDLASRTENANFCIKAFTDNGSALQSAELFAAIDNEHREYESDKVYSLEEVLSTGIPISERYLEWYRRRNSGETASLTDAESEFVLGEIPAIIDAGTNTISFVEGALLPSSYDLRLENCVTDVRDQGGWGSCWTHAIYASLESCLMKKAKTVSVSSLHNATGSMDALALAGQYGVSASSLKLSDEVAVVAVGSTYRLIATLEPVHTTENALIWFSDNETVATVDTNGTVTAHQPGSAVITVSSADGSLSARCSVMVNVGETVRNVTFEWETVSKAVGEVFMANYTINPAEASNKSVTWFSSNPDVVSVNENGRMEAVAVGTAMVTVTTVDGNCTDALQVNVTDGLDFAFTNLTSNLQLYSTAFFGSVDIALENRTDDNSSVTLCIAMYAENERMIGLYLQTETVRPGNNSITFNNLAFESASGVGHKIKCFALNDLTWMPVAACIEKEL